uniref:BTB domain-containing protein n=1 Tax=Panagrellus redivivus TaxID=6233 RepID=A0A7E4ZYC2_PANRE
MVSTDSEGNQSPDLADSFRSLRLSEDLSDVTLVVDGKDFPAHKVVLAARSKVFKKIMTDADVESQRNPIIALVEPKTKASIFRDFLSCVYDEDIDLNVTKALGILDLAHYYNIPNIVTTCANFLKNAATPDNSLIIGEAVCDHDDELWKFFAQFITDHPHEVLKSALLPQMSADFLAKIVDFNFRNLDERDLFKFLLPWFDAHEDANERQQVLKFVRFPFMKPKFLSDTVFRSKVLTEQQYAIALHAATSLNFEGQTEFSVTPRAEYESWQVTDSYHILMVGDYRLCAAFKKDPQPRKKRWTVPCVFPKTKPILGRFPGHDWFDTDIYASPCQEGTLFEVHYDPPENGVLIAKMRKIWF